MWVCLVIQYHATQLSTNHDIILHGLVKSHNVDIMQLTTQREYYNLVKEGNIREALITMGVERAKDVSQANQLMNLRKVNAPSFFTLSVVSVLYLL